jgi:hypothetical protein
VYYYHGQVTQELYPYQLRVVLFLWTTCMCIIIMIQSHMSPICINTVIIILYDDLYVSHYHDPVTHKYYGYQRRVICFLGKRACVLLLWPSNTLVLPVSAPIHFPPNDN